MNGSHRPLLVWLAAVCALIFSMVVVGGITRLTRSGLSITEWKPVTGALPPLSEKTWEETFAKYKETPEYLKINRGMNLDQFKSIFFWEYIHRLLGRLTGLVYLVPFLFFLLRRKPGKDLARRLWIGLFLGSLEGPMGWCMVKSGLVDAPRVSHYRLAAHLALAFIVFAYLFKIILDLRFKNSQEGKPSVSSLRTPAFWLIVGICLEVLYGAFTAGLKAGYGYNTFPTMNGHWIPPDFFLLSPLWKNFFENGSGVQFLHRAIGAALLLGILAFRFQAGRYSLNREQKWGVNLLVAIFAVQAVLGILTLVFVVPISLAVLHQGAAVLLFAASLFVYHSFARRSIYYPT